MDLPYAETTYRYTCGLSYRNNEDNPSLSIDGIEAQGLAHKVLFLAQPGETYSLYYGNPNAGLVSYDSGQAPAVPGHLSRHTDRKPWRAGGQSPEFAVPQPPFSERFPWLIPVGVAAAAAVMALLLFGFFKQARKIAAAP